MNYRRLFRVIENKYWDVIDPKVDRVLKKLAKAERKRGTEALKADPNMAQCGCGRWVNLRPKWATCRCGNSFW